MLSRTRQLQFIKAEFDAIEAILMSEKQSRQKKGIHDLRVHIKRLRALFALYDALKYNIPGLHYKKLRQLFRYSGEVREAQLIIEKFGKYAIGKEYLRYYQSLLEAATLKLKFRREHFLELIRELPKEIEPHIITIPERDVLRYLRTQKNEVSGLLSPADPSLWHEGRKGIKKLLYVHRLCLPPTQKKSRLHEEELDQVQDLIGKWHDADVIVESFLELHMDPNSKTMRSLQDKKELLRNEVSAALAASSLFSARSPSPKSRRT
jgi:CHAD domain-containing protein